MDLTKMIGQLFFVFAPIVRRILEDHRAKTGQDPTDAEMLETFIAHIDQYVAEGTLWQAQHPRLS